MGEVPKNAADVNFVGAFIAEVLELGQVIDYIACKRLVCIDITEAWKPIVPTAQMQAQPVANRVVRESLASVKGSRPHCFDHCFSSPFSK
jgi:hypothetical protein